MPRGFDPDKARAEAEKAVESAEADKAKLVAKVEPAEAKVKAAKEAQAKAAAAKQVAVDAAEKKLAEVNEDVKAADNRIARLKDYLERTASFSGTAIARENAPEGETVPVI
jgi:flagellar motility protein MotE (MotC chaperone)